MKRKIIGTLVLLLLIGLASVATWHLIQQSAPSANTEMALETIASPTPTTLLSNTGGNSPVLGKEISGLPEHCADKQISVSGCEGMTEITSELGNTYPLVEIGDQCWLADNLKEIPTTNKGWYGYYDEKEEAAAGEGMLYTWDAAMNGETEERSRGICPIGWHIPSECEFKKFFVVVAKNDVSIQGKGSVTSIESAKLKIMFKTQLGMIANAGRSDELRSGQMMGLLSSKLSKDLAEAMIVLSFRESERYSLISLPISNAASLICLKN